MKFDRKILTLSLLFGLVAAVLDNVLDNVLFYDESFWNLLVFDVPAIELYTRAFIVGTFLIFGAIVSHTVFLRRRAEARLQHLNRVLRALRDVNHLISRETEPVSLLDRACEILVSTRGYHSAWAARLEDGRPVAPFHHAGIGDDFARMANQLQVELLPPCAQRAMARGSVDIVVDPLLECPGCPNVPKYPDRSGMTAPIEHGDRVFGWITVSVPRAYAGDLQELELLMEVASDLGQALWNMETEKELLSSARRMAHFVDSSPAGMLLYELRDGDDLILVGANPAADRMLGGELSARTGEPLEEVFPGLADTEVPARYRTLASHGGTWHAPRFPYSMDGRRRVYDVTAFQISPMEMAVMFLDVTDEDAADAALRESEARFRGVIEQVNDGIYILFEGRFDLVNRRFCELTGVTPEETRAPDFDLWTLVAPESMALIRERQEARARGEEVPAVYPFDIRRKDGWTVHVEASVMEIDYRGGKAVLGLLRDVSEQRSLQAQLYQVQKMESIGRLSGGIAHDLNNLLTPILGFGEMLTEELSGNGEGEALAGEIVQAAFRARKLVRQLLAFGRRQTLEFRSLDLNRMVSDFEALLVRTIPERIEMELRLAPSVPRIQGDRGQLEQVFMNLAINACDAMPDGGTLVVESGEAELDDAYASVHPGVRPGRYVTLTINDEGVGMDAETQARIFEPFFTTKEKGRGTGLGLATVYGIVKQHRGNIWVYSEPGQGTRFRCYFPVSGQQPAEHSPQSEGARAASVSMGGESVMVVEDEESVRRLSVRTLERHGYEVLSAGDGQECLAALEEREGRVTLLLTDVGLPGMNGRELYREVERRYPGMRVLFMSGYSEEVVTHEGVLERGIDLIQKPFTVQALTEKVREVLDRNDPKG